MFLISNPIAFILTDYNQLEFIVRIPHWLNITPCWIFIIAFLHVRHNLIVVIYEVTRQGNILADGKADNGCFHALLSGVELIWLKIGLLIKELPCFCQRWECFPFVAVSVVITGLNMPTTIFIQANNSSGLVCFAGLNITASKRICGQRTVCIVEFRHSLPQQDKHSSLHRPSAIPQIPSSGFNP